MHFSGVQDEFSIAASFGGDIRMFEGILVLHGMAYKICNVHIIEAQWKSFNMQAIHM